MTHKSAIEVAILTALIAGGFVLYAAPALAVCAKPEPEFTSIYFRPTVFSVLIGFVLASIFVITRITVPSRRGTGRIGILDTTILSLLCGTLASLTVWIGIVIDWIMLVGFRYISGASEGWQVFSLLAVAPLLLIILVAIVVSNLSFPPHIPISLRAKRVVWLSVAGIAILSAAFNTIHVFAFTGNTGNLPAPPPILEKCSPFEHEFTTRVLLKEAVVFGALIATIIVTRRIVSRKRFGDLFPDPKPEIPPTGPVA